MAAARGSNQEASAARAGLEGPVEPAELVARAELESPVVPVALVSLAGRVVSVNPAVPEVLASPAAPAELENLVVRAGPVGRVVRLLRIAWVTVVPPRDLLPPRAEA